MREFYVKSLDEKRTVKEGNCYLGVNTLVINGELKLLVIDDKKNMFPLNYHRVEFLGFLAEGDLIYKPENTIVATVVAGTTPEDLDKAINASLSTKKQKDIV